MKYLITTLMLTTIAFSQTTMCYKNNWNDPATIEQQIFDGGDCKGINTIEQMKLDGWTIDDIKLSAKNDQINYIYILKKSSTTISKDINYKQISKNIKIQEKQKLEEKQLNRGKEYYIKTCQKCHGKKGKLETSGTSRPLDTLSLEELKISIRGYTLNEYDRGLGILMIPYASLVSEDDLTNIYEYLQSIKD